MGVALQRPFVWWGIIILRSISVRLQSLILALILPIPTTLQKIAARKPLFVHREHTAPRTINVSWISRKVVPEVIRTTRCAIGVKSARLAVQDIRIVHRLIDVSVHPSVQLDMLGMVPYVLAPQQRPLQQAKYGLALSRRSIWLFLLER